MIPLSFKQLLGSQLHLHIVFFKDLFELVNRKLDGSVSNVLHTANILAIYTNEILNLSR